MIVSLLSSRFSLSLSFALSLSLSLSDSLFLLFSIRCQSLGRCHSFLFSFSFSRSLARHPSYTNQNNWPMKSILCASPRRERIYECVCRCECLDVVVTAFDKSRLFCPRKKLCARDGERKRELIKHFRRLLHDLLISQWKRTYTCACQGKIGSRRRSFPSLSEKISGDEDITCWLLIRWRVHFSADH